jgi:hypothetical protein
MLTQCPVRTHCGRRVGRPWARAVGLPRPGPARPGTPRSDVRRGCASRDDTSGAWLGCPAQWAAGPGCGVGWRLA